MFRISASAIARVKDRWSTSSSAGNSSNTGATAAAMATRGCGLPTAAAMATRGGGLSHPQSQAQAPVAKTAAPHHRQAPRRLHRRASRPDAHTAALVQNHPAPWHKLSRLRWPDGQDRHGSV